MISVSTAGRPERRSIHWWGATLVLAALVPTVGCQSADENANEGDQPIYGGTRDDESAAVLALRIQWPGKSELCSGTLIAKNLVLTARHCISQQIVPQISCDDQGRSLNGPQFGGDADPSAIKVFSGIGAEMSKIETARGKKIFHPEGTTLCNADIAIVVLDVPLVDVDPIAVRRDGKLAASETVRTVGFGKNDLGSAIGTRIRRDRVSVIATGSGISKYNTALGANEFEVGLSSCNGDSGGPAISEATGAVVGVVSRGGDCASNFGHVYTSTTGFDSMFAAAFAAADATPVAEDLASIPSGTPSTPGASGGSTTNEGGDSSEPAKASGCSTSPRTGTRSAAQVFIVAAFGLLFRRRTAKRRSPAR